jgi:hypothetical protein
VKQIQSATAKADIDVRAISESRLISVAATRSDARAAQMAVKGAMYNACSQSSAITFAGLPELPDTPANRLIPGATGCVTGIVLTVLLLIARRRLRRAPA